MPVLPWSRCAQPNATLTASKRTVQAALVLSNWADQQSFHGCFHNRVAEKLFCVGKGDVGAEADHAESGGGALACAEGGARFEFAFEWSG